MSPNVAEKLAVLTQAVRTVKHRYYTQPRVTVTYKNSCKIS